MMKGGCSNIKVSYTIPTKERYTPMNRKFEETTEKLSQVFHNARKVGGYAPEIIAMIKALYKKKLEIISLMRKGLRCLKEQIDTLTEAFYQEVSILHYHLFQPELGR